MAQRTCRVTGANAGIGWAASLQLAPREAAFPGQRFTRWPPDDGAPSAPAASPPQLRDPGKLTFEAKLLRSDASGAACFVNFPWDPKATDGKGNLVPIQAVWDGKVSYRGSLAMMGGECAMLLCRKDVVAQLGKGPGEEVTVTVTLDTTPREVEVPPALADALSRAPGAKCAWEALSASCRRDCAQWIAEAKREETRAARVQKALLLIGARKRLKERGTRSRPS